MDDPSRVATDRCPVLRSSAPVLAGPHAASPASADTSAWSAPATDLYYSGGNVLEERQGSAVTAQNVWGVTYANDLLLRDDNSTAGGLGVAGSGLGRRLYAQRDANFNVTALVDNGGNVQERFAYDPYGAVTALSPTWAPTAGDATGWAYLFQGMRLDPATGLYHTPNREYSATLGRWLRQDPAGSAGSGSDLYASEGSAPAGKVDPSGLAMLPSGWAGAMPSPALAGGSVAAQMADPGAFAADDARHALDAASALDAMAATPHELYTADPALQTAAAYPASSGYGDGAALAAGAAALWEYASTPMMPQVDDGTGTPASVACSEMAFDAFTGHIWSQGFDVLGVPDWHVNGPGTNYGHAFDEYRPYTEAAGLGAQFLLLEGIGAAVEGVADARAMAGAPEVVGTEAYSLNSAATGARTLGHDGDLFLSNARNAIPEDGFYDVAVHGNLDGSTFWVPDGMGSGVDITHRDLNNSAINRK